MEKKIKDLLQKIRPKLQADGGDVEFVDFTDDGVVQVRLKGACQGCPMAELTLKEGIGRLLKEELPEVKDIQGVK
ncbi:MAG TPA: NifU family protein [Patescibacteria group bacterium]|nr:NifU family protein [Patescibacteria group bacterium]